MSGNFSEEDDMSYDIFEYFNENAVAVEASHSMRVVSVVLYSLTCLLGIPGNAFVLWIAGVKMKRTVNTIWFLNLAIADLACCLSIPFSLVDILLDHHWPYGDIMCKVLPSVIVLNMFASVFTLTLISLDRFALVIQPVWAQNHRHLSLAWCLCGVAWVLALLLSLPSMIYRRTFFDEYDNVTVCVYPPSDEVDGGHGDGPDDGSFATGTIQVVRLVFGFLVPLLVITMCYSLIVRRVSSSHFQSGKALRIILAVVVSFFVCWLPYHVVGLARDYGGEPTSSVAQALDPLTISLAYINSCLNPVLYVFMGQDFKEKVKLSLRRVFENAFSEDVTHSTVHSKGQMSRATNSSEAQL